MPTNKLVPVRRATEEETARREYTWYLVDQLNAAAGASTAPFLERSYFLEGEDRIRRRDRAGQMIDVVGLSVICESDGAYYRPYAADLRLPRDPGELRHAHYKIKYTRYVIKTNGKVDARAIHRRIEECLEARQKQLDAARARDAERTQMLTNLRAAGYETHIDPDGDVRVELQTGVDGPISVKFFTTAAGTVFLSLEPFRVRYPQNAGKVVDAVARVIDVGALDIDRT